MDEKIAEGPRDVGEIGGRQAVGMGREVAVGKNVTHTGSKSEHGEIMAIAVAGEKGLVGRQDGINERRLR